MSIQANYQAFCDIVDIQSFIDYFAAQLYIHNQDWPNNNFRMWRVRTPEPGNPYGDCKWRFMMYDVEFSNGIYQGGSATNEGDPFQRIRGKGRNADIFVRLMNNTDFARRFVMTMMDLHNVNFEYNSLSAKLDDTAQQYRHLITAHYLRFGPSWAPNGGLFDREVTALKRYFNEIRSYMTNTLLPANFSNTGITASNLVNVTLSCNTLGASIKINTVTPVLRGGSWTGKYYAVQTLPVTVTASDINGYTFTGWTVSSNGTAAAPGQKTTTVTFTGNVQITANYAAIP